MGTWTPSGSDVYLSGGKVGINNASPSASLDVVDDSQTVGLLVRHSNLTQGIGIGYNTIAANGSNTNQDLNIAAKGTGLIGVTAKRVDITGAAAYNGSYPNTGIVVIHDAANTARIVSLGYDPTLESGFIQAAKYGVAYEPLLLNPNGGDVTLAGQAVFQANGTCYLGTGGAFVVDSYGHATLGLNGQLMLGISGEVQGLLIMSAGSGQGAISLKVASAPENTIQAYTLPGNLASIPSGQSWTMRCNSSGVMSWALATSITGAPSTWPTTFPPASHTHYIGDVNGLQAALDALSASTSTGYTNGQIDSAIASAVAAKVTAADAHNDASTQVATALEGYSTTSQMTTAINAFEHVTSTDVATAISSAISTALGSYPTTAEMNSAIAYAVATAVTSYFTKSESDARYVHA